MRIPFSLRLYDWVKAFDERGKGDFNINVYHEAKYSEKIEPISSKAVYSSSQLLDHYIEKIEKPDPNKPKQKKRNLEELSPVEQIIGRFIDYMKAQACDVSRSENPITLQDIKVGMEKKTYNLSDVYEDFVNNVNTKYDNFIRDAELKNPEKIEKFKYKREAFNIDQETAYGLLKDTLHHLNKENINIINNPTTLLKLDSFTSALLPKRTLGELTDSKINNELDKALLNIGLTKKQSGDFIRQVDKTLLSISNQRSVTCRVYTAIGTDVAYDILYNAKEKEPLIREAMKTHFQNSNEIDARYAGR